MSLLRRFVEYIKNEALFQKKDRLLLAVSGGIDSVVLCELCRQAGYNFEIAHCNFQLRGEESERDEAFIQSVGDSYSAKVFIKKFDTEKYATEKKVSIQVAARELRYEWFENLIASAAAGPLLTPEDFPKTSHITHCISYILTAHHASDNVETLLMNFFKGTGIKGLQGILPKQGKIIRPLLFAKKLEIVSFAKENNLSFVEDSSNLSDKYTRNYFRNQLIPSIKKVFPEVEENLLHNIERFKDAEMLYQQAIQLHKGKLLEYKGNEIHIPVLKLLKAEPLSTIIYEIIKDYGFTAHQAVEVIHLLKSGSGRFISSTTYKIIKDRKWIIISPNNTSEASNILIDEHDSKIIFENGQLEIIKIEKGESSLSAENSIAMLDVKDITYPLLLRKWKQGDYFYPLGMQKKKKISRFLIDQKLSMNDKEKIWIIESNKKIAWIVGKRIDDRFKIANATKKILKISFTER